MPSTRWLQRAHQSPTGEPEIELPLLWMPMEGCVDIVWSRCQINGTDFSELVVTNTPKELRHIALGCRVSRLPREWVQETHLPRMGYVKNDDRTPLGYTVGIVQTQGSSLREQPWALKRNSVGVEDIDNKDQGQISSYQVLRTGENVGVAVAALLMEIPKIGRAHV